MKFFISAFPHHISIDDAIKKAFADWRKNFVVEHVGSDVTEFAFIKKLVFKRVRIVTKHVNSSRVIKVFLEFFRIMIEI